MVKGPQNQFFFFALESKNGTKIPDLDSLESESKREQKKIPGAVSFTVISRFAFIRPRFSPLRTDNPFVACCSWFRHLSTLPAHSLSKGMRFIFGAYDEYDIYIYICTYCMNNRNILYCIDQNTGDTDKYTDIWISILINISYVYVLARLRNFSSEVVWNSSSLHVLLIVWACFQWSGFLKWYFSCQLGDYMIPDPPIKGTIETTIDEKQRSEEWESRR